MKTKKAFRLAAMAMLFAALPISLLHAAQGGEVQFSGRILADDNNNRDLRVTVETGSGEPIACTLRANGTFQFAMQPGLKATIRVTKPGYFTKEIAVDSHNALCSPNARKMYKHVRFDVQMQECPWDQRRFAGPVGAIAFAKGTGRVLIKHDRTLVDLAGPTFAELERK